MSKLKLAQSVLNLSEVDAWQLFLRELKGCALPNSSLAATPTPLFPFRFNGVTLHLPARLDDKPWRSAGRAVQSGAAIPWEIGCLQVEPRAALLRSGGLRSWFLGGVVRRLEKIATPGKAAAVEIADEDIQAIKGAWARCQFDQDELVRRLSNVSGEYLDSMFEASSRVLPLHQATRAVPRGGPLFRAPARSQPGAGRSPSLEPCCQRNPSKRLCGRPGAWKGRCSWGLRGCRPA